MLDHLLKRKWIKYILLAIPLIVGIILLIKAYMPSKGWEGLTYFILSIFDFVAIGIILITSIIIDTIRESKKKNKRVKK